MPNYMNPATMYGKNGWQPEGALGGFLAGQQNAYAKRMADDSIRDNDLGFMSEMHKYEQSLLDDPNNDMKRQVNTAIGKDTLEDYESGGPAAKRQAERDKIIAETKGKQQEIEDKNAASKSQWVEQAANLADNFDPMNPTIVEAWQDHKEQGKNKYQIKNTPDRPDKQYAAALRKLVTQSAMSNPKFLQEQSKDAANNASREKVSAATNASNERKSAATDTSRQEVANIRREGLRLMTTWTAQNLTAVSAQINREVATTGSISPETEEWARSIAMQSATAELKQEWKYVRLEMAFDKAESPEAKKEIGKQMDLMVAKATEMKLQTLLKPRGSANPTTSKGGPPDDGFVDVDKLPPSSKNNSMDKLTAAQRAKVEAAKKANPNFKKDDAWWINDMRNKGHL